MNSAAAFWKVYVALIALFTLHLLVMTCLWLPVSVGPDTNGYYIQTRLLGDEGRLWTKHEQQFQYVSQHWLIVNNDMLISRYPPGIAILQVIPYWVFGTGFTLLNPILTTGTLLGVFFISRIFVGAKWALLAFCITAVNPVMNSWAFEGDAHPAVVFFMIWGIYAVLRWSISPNWLSLVPIALWMGMIPTFRYPEALFIPAFSLFIWGHQRWCMRGFLQGTLFGIVGLLPLLMVYIYNQSIFGSFGETGYGTGEHLFSLWYFVQKLIPYPLMIIGYGVTGFSLFGMLGLYWLCKSEETRSTGILFCGIVIPITILYMAYFFFDGTMRFLMPTYPLYIIAGVWYLQYLHSTYPNHMAKWTPRIIILTLLIGMIESGFAVGNKVRGHQDIYYTSQQLSTLVPKGCVLIAPETIQNQMDFLGGWKLVNEGVIQNQEDRPPGMPGGPRGRSKDAPHHDRPPMFGMDEEFMNKLMQHDKQLKIRKYYQSSKPGTLSQQTLDDLKTWSEKQHAFYWLGHWNQINNQLSDEFSLEAITEMEVPNLSRFGPHPKGPPHFDDENRFHTKLTLVKVVW